MDIQAMVDGMSARWMRERADTQMTLGKLIEGLQQIPSDTMIDGIENPHSYRGYYSDLSFVPRYEQVTAGDLLKVCQSCMGRVFHGWKGGEYVMGALTPLWVADRGSCGKKLMTINPDGSLVLADDEF